MTPIKIVTDYREYVTPKEGMTFDIEVVHVRGGQIYDWNVYSMGGTCLAGGGERSLEDAIAQAHESLRYIDKREIQEAAW